MFPQSYFVTGVENVLFTNQIIIRREEMKEKHNDISFIEQSLLLFKIMVDVSETGDET